MAQIIVRNLDDSVRDRLRKLAALRGQSLEETVRQILKAAVARGAAPATGLGTRIAERFRGAGLADDIPELRGHAIRPPDFTS